MASRTQALRYAKKVPYFDTSVYYVNAQRLEWKRALSFAVLQLALGSFLVLRLTYFDSVPPPQLGQVPVQVPLLWVD
jgi:hypothetical protein